MNTKQASQSVKEFQDTFQPPKSEAFWISLIQEEAAEVKEAYANLFKELADLLYVIAGLGNQTGTDLTAVLDGESLERVLAAIEVLDVIDDHGVSPEFVDRAFELVHQSNMSKVDDNGNPIRDPETGKIQKGPNYKAPDIEAMIFG